MTSLAAISRDGMLAAQHALGQAAAGMAALARSDLAPAAAPGAPGTSGTSGAPGASGASGAPAAVAGRATPWQAPSELPDLATHLVGLKQAELAFAANLAVFRTADRMAGSLLDVLA